MATNDDVRNPQNRSELQSREAAWLCLDFVNTVDLRLSLHQESLAHYTDLVRWSQQVGIAEEQEAHRLLELAAASPTIATAAFERSLALRETMYAVFLAVAQGREPETVDLDMLNSALAEATVPMRLVPTQPGFERVWLDDKDSFDWMLGPVVRSAAELLTSNDLRRLKACPGSPGRACGWLFVDTSKNQRRQWCVGAVCGNRARVQRHYARKHIDKQP